jgi:hypothetical protein
MMATWAKQLPKPGSVHQGAGADPHDYGQYVEDELFGRRSYDMPEGYATQLRMVLATYENPVRGRDHSPRIVITATTVPGEDVVVSSSIGGRMYPLFSHTACQSPSR